MAGQLTWYDILDVSPGAPADEVQRAFAAKASVLRPELISGAPSNAVSAAGRASAAIEAARQVLTDPARRPGVQTPGNRPVPSLTPGDRVNHDAYGLGTVLSVEGRGDDPEAKIDFGGDYGIKHLVLRFAPIEKL